MHPVQALLAFLIIHFIHMSAAEFNDVALSENCLRVCLLFWPTIWILRCEDSWTVSEICRVGLCWRQDSRGVQEDLVDYRGANTDSGKNTESGMRNIKRWVRIRQTPQYLGAVQVFSGWNRQTGLRISSWTNSLLVCMKLVRGFRRWIKTFETSS